MINTKSKKEIIFHLIEIAEKFEASKEKYLITYPYFLDYFKNLDEINKEHLIIGISFTYSWMPTILNFSPNDLSQTHQLIEECLNILNKAKLQTENDKLLSIDELFKLKKLFNNSLVGTSKLLHFINPKQYAIWDSKVFKNLYNEVAHKYKLEKPEAYLAYLKFIKSLTLEENFDEFHTIMKERCNPEITKFRAIELALFKTKS